MGTVISIIIVLVMIAICWVLVANAKKTRRKAEEKVEWDPNSCPIIDRWGGMPDCSHCSEEGCSVRRTPFWYVEKGTWWKIPVPGERPRMRFMGWFRKKESNTERPPRSKTENRYSDHDPHSGFDV